MGLCVIMKPIVSQLELAIERPKEADRNYHLGGRSFYFFDFDDNVAFLSTKLVLFHKETQQELHISSGEYAQHHHTIGKHGAFENFAIDFCNIKGTYRNFRDLDLHVIQQLQGKKQNFVQDIIEALGMPDFQWKGPSWSCFYHAAFNQRPISVITARGHAPQTIIEGIDQFLQAGLLPAKPNYLSIYPVSHVETRQALGDQELKQAVPSLKQAAIRASVEKAFQTYGYSPHHRFGMSDDDPKNVQLIFEEMTRLKSAYPEVSFFLIETEKGEYVKHEILHNNSTTGVKVESEHKQFSLF